MPLSSDFKRSKNDPVDSTRVIDSVSSMTRAGKGVGFGASTSSRFGDSMGSPTHSSSMKSPTRPHTTGNSSLPPCSPVSDTRSVSSGKKSHGTISMYGKDRQLNDQKSEGGIISRRSDPINSKWTASMGLGNKPKPFTSEELEQRRTQPLGRSGNNILGGGGDHTSAFSPVVIVDEELAAREARGQRPGSRTSSFCNGRRYS